MNDAGTVLYEELAAGYWQNLTNVLRGFNPASGLDFLELWVHDEDDVTSILNMIEAARESKRDRVVIAIGLTTLAKIDLERLQAEAGKIGTVRVEKKGESLDLDVFFKTSEPFTEIQSIYREKLRSSCVSAVHCGALQAKADLQLVHGSVEGIILAALISPQDHVIQTAAYAGATSEIQRVLLELLCGLLEQKPVLEGSDHAVLELEYSLRDPSAPRPVPGVTAPENTDPVFALLTQLVRDLLDNYRETAGYRETKNQYVKPLSEQWRRLTKNDRMRRVQEAINAHGEAAGVRLTDLEGALRVVIGFDGNVEWRSKQKRIVKLEKWLKNTVEPGLQVYLQPKADQNQLRTTQENLR